MLCSMSKTVTPASRSRLSSEASRPSSTSVRPVAGSSRMSTVGRAARARASSSSLRSPNGREEAGASTLSPRPREPSSAAASRRSSRSRLRDRGRRRTLPTRLRSATRWKPASTFSTAGMAPKTSACWKTRPRPMWAMWSGRGWATRCPRNSIVPASAGRTPETRLTSVVFPDPLGPINPWIVPRSTTRSRPSTARTPPNSLVSPRTSRTGPSGAGRRGAGRTAVGSGSSAGASLASCLRRVRKPPMVPATPRGRNTITAKRMSPEMSAL